MLSSYLVKVRATRDGDSAEGVVTVPFLNLYAINRFIKHYVVPDVQLVATKLDGRTLEASFIVRHWEQGPVVTRDVALRFMSCGDAQSTDIDTSDVKISKMTFPPGKSEVTMRVTVPEGICSATADLTGKVSDGSPIYLELSAPVPGAQVATEPLTLDLGTPEGQAMAAQLEAAGRLLNVKSGGRISMADLQRLEASGALPPMPAPVAPAPQQ
jgi:hypothetical protein